jgi:hypothetical protein
MKICRADWERVLEIAYDIANATESNADPMLAVHVDRMMILLDELEAKYGPQSQILATLADYLDDVGERRLLYEQALDLARKAEDTNEIEEIMDSINELEEEEAERAAGPTEGPAKPSGDSQQ